MSWSYYLFCNESMIGIFLENRFDDRFLREPIHLRHEISRRGFRLNREGFLEMILENFPGSFCSSGCDGEGISEDCGDRSVALHFSQECLAAVSTIF